jgi:hypothetical protein
MPLLLFDSGKSSKICEVCVLYLEPLCVLWVTHQCLGSETAGGMGNRWPRRTVTYPAEERSTHNERPYRQKRDNDTGKKCSGE